MKHLKFSKNENKKKFMNIINKNELTVLVIALMLVTAGYLDYLGKIKTEDVNSSETIEETAEVVSEEEVEIAKTGDATLVSAEVGEDTEMISNNEVENEKKEENVEVDSTIEDSYFVTAKLERTKMYSQNIENYQDILNNQNVSETQKSIATQEIEKINKIQNAIMISENLLLAKGFVKCVIFVNNESISVIIGKEELKPEELAQIQNIVSRELSANIENIHISTK